jgi:cytosine/adenosine deaminase-related metal-dependent hydrolase
MNYITATALFNAQQQFEKDVVLVVDDTAKIVAIEKVESIDPLLIQQYEGVLVPGLVNTHCHLELSHLKGKIAAKKGFGSFVSDLISLRGTSTEEERYSAMRSAETEMMEQGTVAVGDISNELITAAIKQENNLYYHTFLEVLGLKNDQANTIWKRELEKLQFFQNLGDASPTAHATYSVSDALFAKLSDYQQQHNSLYSMHAMESQDELQFFIDKSGGIRAFFDRINIDSSDRHLTGKNPIQSVLPHLPPTGNMLLVHNTYMNAEDLTSIQQHHPSTYFCACPKANLYIENRLPNYELFAQQKALMTMGTDSLASNDTLSIWEEIKTIAKAFPLLPIQQLLTWGTSNGAKFLRKEGQLGSFEIGKQPGINLLSKELLTQPSEATFIKALFSTTSIKNSY